MDDRQESMEDRIVALERKLSEHEGDAHPKTPPIANPGPLGLFAFGITTLLLNIVNSGMVESASISIVLGYGMFYGGLAQMLAAMWEMRRGNTFAATAFGSYSAFWMGLALWHILADAEVLNPSSEFKGGFAAYLAVWGMFTGLMFVPTLKLNRAVQSIFLTLTILFFLLAAGVYNDTVHKIAGFEGIICAFTAIYTAWAMIVNDTWGKEVLPLWPVKAK